jgi:hypothetical protein
MYILKTTDLLLNYFLHRTHVKLIKKKGQSILTAPFLIFIAHLSGVIVLTYLDNTI